MLVIYTSTGNVQARKIKSWLQTHKMNYVEKDIQNITKKELVLILSRTGSGFHEVLKAKGKYIEELGELDNLTFDELCNCILNEKRLLRCPIVFDGNQILTGFNADRIREFIPPQIRRGRREIYENRIL